jgi:hypothetical protein
MHRLASRDPASTPWASNRLPNRATCRGPSWPVMASWRRLAAPLARRQRRALPLSGPPGARRATLRRHTDQDGSNELAKYRSGRRLPDTALGDAAR